MKLAIILLLLLLTVPTYGQRQTDVCRLTVSVWNQRERKGTSKELLQEFKISVRDEAIKRSFRYPELPLMINVGVEYLGLVTNRTGKPDRIRIAISISDEEEDAFDVIDNAVAGTSHKQHWGGLYVEKQHVIDQSEHRFTFYCGDATKEK